MSASILDNAVREKNEEGAKKLRIKWSPENHKQHHKCNKVVWLALCQTDTS